MDDYNQTDIFVLAYPYLFVYFCLCVHSYAYCFTEDYMTSNQKRLTFLRNVIANLLWPLLLISFAGYRIVRSDLRYKSGRRWRKLKSRSKRRFTNRRVVGRQLPIIYSSHNVDTIAQINDDRLIPLGERSHAEMKKLQIVYITENSMPQYQLDGDSSCTICLSLISYRHQSDGSIIIRDVPSDNEPCATTCHHVMHCGCLRDWLIRNPICPVCRQTQSITACRVLRIRNGETVPGGFTNANTADLRTISTICSPK